ncbi:TFIIIC transcription initiation factor complex subunits Tfc3 [Colletotrichum tofieldiae]|nr:TFIIIC transcription initiation factor complex subunits Tfc3 [Colletotrichum tofieldiae]
MERALLYILRANGGVFAGGQSLWYAVIATWEVTFPSEEAPDHQRYKDALARLAKKKQVVVSTHAFKDSRGMMANYQLIRIPGVEASSPAGVAMKANIVAEHPRVYIPPAFTPKAGLPEEHKKRMVTKEQLTHAEDEGPTANAGKTFSASSWTDGAIRVTGILPRQETGRVALLLGLFSSVLTPTWGKKCQRMFVMHHDLIYQIQSRRIPQDW